MSREDGSRRAEESFSRYINKWPWDIAERLRRIASFNSLDLLLEETNNLLKYIVEIYNNYHENINCELYKYIIDEVKSKYEILIIRQYDQCNSAKIEIRADDCLAPPFTKRPITKVEYYQITNDDDKRASPIIGALRWALEKYIFLHIMTFPNIDLIKKIILTFLAERNRNRNMRKIIQQFLGQQNKNIIEQLLSKNRKWFPSNIVFGAAGGDDSVPSYRSSVIVKSVDWQEEERKLTLELSIDPPPYVVLTLRDLGFAGAEKEIISSLLGVAAVMLTRLDSYNGEAPVPLGKYGCQDVTVEMCRGTSYDLAAMYIENAVCNIVEKL